MFQWSFLLLVVMVGVYLQQPRSALEENLIWDSGLSIQEPTSGLLQKESQRGDFWIRLACGYVYVNTVWKEKQYRAQVFVNTCILSFYSRLWMSLVILNSYLNFPSIWTETWNCKHKLPFVMVFYHGKRKK